MKNSQTKRAETVLNVQEERQPRISAKAEPKDSPLFAFFMLVGVISANTLLFKASGGTSGNYTYNTSSAIAVTEFVKLAMSLASRHRSIPEGEKLLPSGISFREYMMWMVLAALYATNNQLSFLLLKVLGPGQLSLGKSFAPMQTAMMMRVFFGDVINKIQWACIVLTVAGLVGVLGKQDGSSDAEESQFGAYGILLLSCTLTSFCSVFNSKLVRRGDTPLDVQNSILYSFGLVFNLLIYGSGLSPSSVPGFFTGYDNPVVIMLLLSQSVIGLAITYV